MAATSVLTIMIQLAKKGDADRSTIKGLAGIKQAAGLAIGTFGALTGAAVAVGAGMKKAFDLGKEGAQIELTRTRFDNLTKSINTTSDVLMGDLREATRGLYSDTELAASAADLMGLGLAKTHEEAVRLSAVSAALNMDMNQLVLTLTNMTTMRFDALGVSVDGFKEKVSALEKQGKSTNEAFKEAFLQQAEAQIDKVGHAADSNAGGFMRLEAAVKNVNDELKIQAGIALSPTASAWADAIEEGIWQGEHYEEILAETNRLLREGAAANQFEANAMAIVNVKIREQTGGLDSASRSYAAYGQALQAATNDQGEFIAAVEEQTSKNKDMLSLMFDLQNETTSYTQKNDELKAKLVELYAEQNKYFEGGRRWNEYQAEIDETKSAMSQLADEHEEAGKRIAFSMLQQKMAVDGLTDAEFASLLSIATEWGIVDQKVAESAIIMDAQATAMAQSMEQPDARLGDIIDKANNLQRKSGSIFDFYVNIHTRGSFPNFDRGTSSGQGSGWANNAAVDREEDLTEVGQAQATGGPLGNGWTMVGERGFELVSPSGWVFTNEESRDLIAAGLAPSNYRMFGGAMDVQETRAVIAGQVASRRARRKSRSRGASPVRRSNNSAGSGNDDAVVETVSAATDVTAEAVQSSVAVQQQATREAIETRNTIQQGNTTIAGKLDELNDNLNRMNATMQRSIVAAVQTASP